MKELNNIELPKKGFKLEKDFTTYYNKKLRDLGYFVYKLTDGSLGSKPFDNIITTNGFSYYMEIKMIDKDIFPIGRLRPNQLKALRLASKLLPGSAIICAYSKYYNQYKIFSFDMIRTFDINDSVKLIFDN